MSQTPTNQSRACPNCGERLVPDADLLRCEQHGLFFAYGPRLLVHTARAASAESPLLPWQTLSEHTVEEIS